MCETAVANNTDVFKLDEAQVDDLQHGVKFDVGKARFDLISAGPLQELAMIYTYGAKKYADRNWEKGMAFGRLYAATQRHLNAFWSGQSIDEESGMHHLAHAAFGMLALMELEKTHPELDDRVVRG